MDRRSLLKLIASGLVGTALDVDKLLWVPGERKIFLPPVVRGLTDSQIIAMEMERILPRIRDLFESDNLFYQTIRSGNSPMTSGPIRIPLVIRPGAIDD